MNKVNPTSLVSEKAKSRWPLLSKAWLYDGLVLLSFIVVSLIFLIPLTGNLAESAINEGDDLQQMWSMGWVIHTLFRDPAHLFQANIFYPYPNTLAYSDHLILQSLLALPIILTSGNLVLGYNLGMVFSFALSGWGSYLLVKDLTGNRAAGLFSGLIFAYAPYKVGHLSQLNLLSTQWIPFCFLFLHRLLRTDLVRTNWRSGWSIALAFGFFFVLNSLSSTYYLFFSLPLLGLYFLLFYLFQWQWPRPIVLLQLAMAFGLAFLVLLPTFLPYLQVSLEQAAERTPREVEQFSANYRFYLGVPEGNFFWGSTLSRYGGLGGERQLFPGSLALLFTLLAIGGPLLRRVSGRVSGVRYRVLGVGEQVLGVGEQVSGNPPTSDTRPPIPDLRHLIPNTQHPTPYIYLVLGIFALLMSFGLVLHVKGLDLPMPYRLFYDYFPGWRGLRAAMRYGLFVLFALSVTAGFGVALLTPYLQHWLTKGVEALALKVPFARKMNFSRVMLWALTGLLLLGAFGEYRSDVTRINPAILPNPPQVYRWLAESSRAGVVLELPMANPAGLPSIRNYYSTFNWQPTIGGESGYMPPVYNDLYALSQDITTKEALATFQGIGVRWLVYHLADENTPLSPDEWAKIEAKLNSSKALKLVQDFPQDKIKVYELAPDAWMERLVDLLPANAPVIVSDYRRNQPVNLELIATFMRRQGHPLYGNDRAGYRFLSAPPLGQPIAFGLFSGDEDPRPYGFSLDEARWSGYGLKFYQRKLKPAAAYDLTKLTEFNQLRSSLELEIGKNELKFNGKSLGSADTIADRASLTLLLSSLEPQTLKIRRAGQETSLALPAGLSTWTAGGFQQGDKLSLEPASGATLYLQRAELGSETGQSSLLAPVRETTLLLASSQARAGHLVSGFDLYAPEVGQGELNNYLLSLDLYRKPWGTHPSGHFGVWSVALNGVNRSRHLEFDFDPVAKTTRVTLDGTNLDVGAEVIRPGDGDWAAFIALRRTDPKNPQNFELLGVSRLYEFNLSGEQTHDLFLLPAQPLAFQPPLR
ncbi:MAG: hypothetical protein HXX20_05635 [Chloroflexi bacterium]|nr:hypothetical protein [Chloroflexota bacterium]